MSHPQLTDRSVYRLWAKDIARFGDTDGLGHLNNATFSTFLETGRVSFLWNDGERLSPPGSVFVIARLELDYRAEMHWGGEVEIGTVVLSIGRTSFRLGQGIFQDGACTATAHTVIVLLDESTRRSTLLPEETRTKLLGWSVEA